MYKCVNVHCPNIVLCPVENILVLTLHEVTLGRCHLDEFLLSFPFELRKKKKQCLITGKIITVFTSKYNQQLPVSVAARSNA